jgi:hypothetical protein
MMLPSSQVSGLRNEFRENEPLPFECVPMAKVHQVSDWLSGNAHVIGVVVLQGLSSSQC